MKQGRRRWREPIEGYFDARGIKRLRCIDAATISGKIMMRGESPGTYRLLARVAGCIEKVNPSQTRLGVVMRGLGVFFARFPGEHRAPVWSESIVFPADLGDALYRTWSRERAELPPRIPAHVLLDYDLWAIAESKSPTGYIVEPQGRHWPVDPVLPAIQRAAEAPLPERRAHG